MRVPSYRRHSSGQARVTLNGKDYLLGAYQSPESLEAYGRLIAEYTASNQSPSFGKCGKQVLMEDVLLAFIGHVKVYYAQSNEAYQYKLTIKPITELYGSAPASEFSAAEFKAVRTWWMADKRRSRQYINKMAQRTLRIVKWAVGEGMMPAANYTACKCIEPLERGRCGDLREAKKISCVAQTLVDQTLPALTKVVADMVTFQLLTGARPGEVCAITPSMVNRTKEIWEIDLAQHKTAWRGKQRIVYVGPQAQHVLAPYLLRAADSPCFSPEESERQRRQAAHEARATPRSCGNIPGSNVARKPRKKPGRQYTTGSYGRAIRYACKRTGLAVWSPNQLRHNAATKIRGQFGLEAAASILGHSEVGVTQVYAEADRTRAIEVARVMRKQPGDTAPCRGVW